MVKKILDFDYEEHLDFALIGIVCAYKDFRLCFEVNKSLRLKMCKAQDFELKKEKRGSSSFHSLFSYNNGDNEQYLLIANKGSNGLLINELKYMDYFILIRNLSPFNSLEYINEQLKKIKLITTVTVLEPSDYKASENFLMIDAIL